MSNNNNNRSRGGGNQKSNNRSRNRNKKKQTKQPKIIENHSFSDDEEVDPNQELCLICCENLIYVALGPCNHTSVCANCTIRQRVLYKNRACSLCKTEMDHFVVTSDRSRLTYESWSDCIFGETCGGRLISDTSGGGSDGFFDKNDSEYLKSVQDLLGYACGKCDHASSGSVEQLKKHLKKEHKTFLCNVCVITGRRFVSELPRFNKSQLERHNTHGEPKEGLRGHPPCNFCRPKRFYDDEQLYHHMVKKHYQCDVCRGMGNGNRFFRNYEMLDRHFHDQHYACEQQECILKRFVVFQSEIDLQGHMATSHSHIKFNRNIAVNFTVGRGMEGGGRGGHGNNNGIDDTMTFSDDFMRTHGNNGRGRSTATNNGNNGNNGNGGNGASTSATVVGGGAVRVENAFPSLQEQKRDQQKEEEIQRKTQSGGNGEQKSSANWVGGGNGLSTVLGRTSRTTRNNQNFPGLSRTPADLNSAQDFPGLPGGGGGGSSSSGNNGGLGRGGFIGSRTKLTRNSSRNMNNRQSSQQQPSSSSSVVHGKVSKDVDPFAGMKSNKIKTSPSTITGGSGGIVWECGRCTLVNKSTNRCTACGAWAQHGREVKTSKTSQSSKSFQSSTSTIPKGIARAASSDVISSSVSSSYSRVDLASATANKKQQAMERQKKIAETIRTILKPDRFKMFQRLCGSYAKQSISAREYFLSVQRLCTYIELSQFWNDLLQMLPNDSMRSPLRDLYEEAASVRAEKQRVASNWTTAGSGGNGGNGKNMPRGIRTQMNQRKAPVRKHKQIEKTSLSSTTTTVPSSVEEWIQLNGSGGGSNGSTNGSNGSKATPPSAPTAASSDFPTLPTSNIKLHRASKKKQKKKTDIVAEAASKPKIKDHGKANKDEDPFACVMASKKKNKQEQNELKKQKERKDSTAESIIEGFSASLTTEPAVKLHGLVVAKKLNGRIGRRGVYSPAKGRYLVHFSNNNPEPLWIKADNMTVVEETKKSYKMNDNLNKKGKQKNGEWDKISFKPGSTNGNEKKKKKKKKKKKTNGAGAGGGRSVSDKGARGGF